MNSRSMFTRLPYKKIQKLIKKAITKAQNWEFKDQGDFYICLYILVKLRTERKKR